MRRAVATCALALTLAASALPLAGCFSVLDAQDVADAATDLAEQATDLADALSSVEWGKLSRLVIRDAETGAVTGELTDQARIEDAFAALSGVNDVAPEPDAAEEYLFEVWQPETIKTGQTEPAGELQVLGVTTYQSSDVISLTVTPIGLTLHLSSPETADTLRALAEA